MKYYTETLSALIGVVIFTACGDSNQKKFINENLMIKPCTSGKFTSLKKGDKVTILADNTELDIRHKQDGTKEACALRGSAKVN